ncbi:P-loop containing nucleoside triphosphate hydrolase protein, partial [Violaceomyces palustris]
DPSKRILVGVCGVPGSGKSSLALHVARKINQLASEGRGEIGLETSSPIAVVVGMDGWHYTRERLSTFPDPQHARDRRGAHFTFDAVAFSNFVERLRNDVPPRSVHLAPSFSHSLKDPVEDDIEVSPGHRIVIVEGLYCNLSVGEWVRGARLFDERWVFEVDRQAAKERLRIRHVLTGVAKDDEEAIWRAENNDLPNGDYLLSNLYEPVVRIQSLEDPSWAGAE